jgi:hypothetical protein
MSSSNVLVEPTKGKKEAKADITTVDTSSKKKMSKQEKKLLKKRL